MSNALAKGQQDMSLREHKLLRLIISQIGIQDKDFSTYSCRMKDLAEFFHISLQAAHKDMKKLCLEMASRVALIETDKNNWETFRWIDKAKCHNGVLNIKISDDLSEHLLYLRSHYLQYQLCEIVELKSVYALRLYEIILSEYNNLSSRNCDVLCIEKTIDELRQELCCKDKHLKISHFKEKVIDTALADINNNTYSKCNIKHQYIKDGKTISAVQFYLIKK